MIDSATQPKSRYRVDSSVARQLAAKYAPGVHALEEAATILEREIRACLLGLDRIDRIAVRVKSVKSFSEKGARLRDDGTLKYKHPFQDLEDQIAARVIVFFRRDIHPVVERLNKLLNCVERAEKTSRSPQSFEYESTHLVANIPPFAHGESWGIISEPPPTFEIQVRTMFMHAWAEGQHDIEYKPTDELTNEEQRKLAWAAANAWGADLLFEQILDSIAERQPAATDPS